MESEIWKPIIGYEGLYEVSNTGIIRSLDRVISTHKGHLIFKKGQQLSYDTTNAGYYRVCLSKNCQTQRFSVHRIVAAHFVGTLCGSLVINHLDGNKTNNHYTNLEICTAQQNAIHACDINLIKCGEQSYKAKLKASDIEYIRFLRNVSGFPLTLLGNYFGVSAGTISAVARYKSWKRV